MNIELTQNMVKALVETIDRRLESDQGVIEMFVEDGDIEDAQHWLKQVNELRDIRVQLVNQAGIKEEWGK